jgi:hypothetical protein
MMGRKISSNNGNHENRHFLPWFKQILFIFVTMVTMIVYVW